MPHASAICSVSSGVMRARSFLSVWLWLNACTGADLVLGDGDATQPDAGDAAARIANAADFAAPHVIAELEADAASDDDPSLTSDLRLLCFNSKRDGGSGGEDIWCSRRARPDDAWGEPESQPQLNSETRETGIALALDGLSIWFSSDRDGGAGGLDIYVASRPTVDDPWSEPTRVAEVSSDDDDLVSSLDESGRSLWLARRARGGAEDADSEGDYDIFIAERATSDDAWQPPHPVPELNTDRPESDASPIGDGRAVLFARDGDLMLARRASLDAAFDHGEPLDALNSDRSDRDPWADDAFTHIVFSSDRAGSLRLYEAFRSEPER